MYHFYFSLPRKFPAPYVIFFRSDHTIWNNTYCWTNWRHCTLLGSPVWNSSCLVHYFRKVTWSSFSSYIYIFLFCVNSSCIYEFCSTLILSKGKLCLTQSKNSLQFYSCSHSWIWANVGYVLSLILFLEGMKMSLNFAYFLSR